MGSVEDVKRKDISILSRANFWRVTADSSQVFTSVKPNIPMYLLNSSRAFYKRSVVSSNPAHAGYSPLPDRIWEVLSPSSEWSRVSTYHKISRRRMSAIFWKTV